MLSDEVKLYFTSFQKEIVELKHELADEKQRSYKKEQNLLIELFETLDAFGYLLDNLKNKENPDRSIKRTIKNLESIQRKLLRILENRGINKIEFPENKAIFGLCKIIETQQDDELAEQTIIKIVKNGFRRGDEIIRPAEVITVKNTG